MEVLPPAQSWPHAALTLVGSELLAAFRPYPRDLATQLLPPGANDRDLEVAAEHLIAAHPELLAERLEQERRYGIDFAPEGHAHLSGQALDRSGLASCLRTLWVSRKAPETLIGFASLADAQAGQVSSDWILIHDPQAPDRLPRSLTCPHTQRTLSLAGSDRTQLIDRTRPPLYQLWSWLEPCVEAGGKVLIGNDRETLLKAWAKAWF